MILSFCIFFYFFFESTMLKNSDYGFRMYLLGFKDDEFQGMFNHIWKTEIWTAACTQVFYSLSLCTGIMITYSSFNKRAESIFNNGLSISILDTAFAYLSGLMLFANIGYLKRHEDNPVLKASQDKPYSLAFIVFP